MIRINHARVSSRADESHDEWHTRRFHGFFIILLATFGVIALIKFLTGHKHPTSKLPEGGQV